MWIYRYILNIVRVKIICYSNHVSGQFFETLDDGVLENVIRKVITRFINNKRWFRAYGLASDLKVAHVIPYVFVGAVTGLLHDGVGEFLEAIDETPLGGRRGDLYGIEPESVGESAMIPMY